MMAAAFQSARALQCASRWSTRCSSAILPSSLAAADDAAHTPQRRFYSPTLPASKKAWDPSLTQYKYWNREESRHGEASYVLDMSPESIQKEARILCLAAEDDDANAPLTRGKLPFGSRLLQVGTQPTDFPDSLVNEGPNVLFVSPSCPHARLQLPLILHKFPTIQWIHVRSFSIQ